MSALAFPGGPFWSLDPCSVVETLSSCYTATSEPGKAKWIYTIILITPYPSYRANLKGPMDPRIKMGFKLVTST